MRDREFLENVHDICAKYGCTDCPININDRCGLYSKDYDKIVEIVREHAEKEDANSDDLRNNYIELIDFYGNTNIFLSAISKFADLVNVVSKYTKYGEHYGPYEEVIEKLADATICMEQIKMILKIDDYDIFEMISKDVKRQIEIINE